jgi:hypothetical protein
VTEAKAQTQTTGRPLGTMPILLRPVDERRRE